MTRIEICVLKGLCLFIIGSFSNDDGNGNENVMKKHKFPLLRSLRDYSELSNMTKVWQSFRNETVTSGG